jgi:anti-sigma B factor antagonist
MSATKFPTLIKSTRRDGDAAVVAVMGEIDLHNSRDLREVLLEQLEDGTAKRLVINLSEVPYMDSSALAAMVESLQRISKTGGKVYLTNLQPRVRGLLEVARLNTIFVVVADEADALKPALS